MVAGYVLFGKCHFVTISAVIFEYNEEKGYAEWTPKLQSLGLFQYDQRLLLTTDDDEEQATCHRYGYGVLERHGLAAKICAVLGCIISLVVFLLSWGLLVRIALHRSTPSCEKRKDAIQNSLLFLDAGWMVLRPIVVFDLFGVCLRRSLRRICLDKLLCSFKEQWYRICNSEKVSSCQMGSDGIIIIFVVAFNVMSSILSFVHARFVQERTSLMGATLS